MVYKTNTIINEIEWNCLFELPFLIINDVKVQWFQYRLIHRILGTNGLLSKMKAEPSSNSEQQNYEFEYKSKKYQF